jgi:hypothetical protein
MATPDPTPKMVALFERQTAEHIQRVRRCLLIMAEATEHGDELRARAEVHDASKYDPEERIPYIWMTEYHRCRRKGKPIAYPHGMESRLRTAIEHHATTNRHHPDSHADPNDMTEVDLIEMVCDWTAMAQEFDQAGGSARKWADMTIGRRVHFNEEKRRFIYEMIDLLDAKLNA